MAQVKNTRALTGFRFFAASLVFFYHFSRRSEFSAFQNGWIGVPFFFCLSGFLFTLLYFRSFQRIELSGLATFYIRRLARIYPAFVLALLAAAILAKAHRPDEFLVNLFLLNQFTGTRYPLVLVVSWTLSLEMCFYLLFPLLVHWLQRIHLSVHRRQTLAVMLGLASTSICSLLLGLLLHRCLNENGAFDSWAYETIFGQFPVFMVGMAAAYLFSESNHRAVLSWSRASSTAICIASVILMAVLTHLLCGIENTAWFNRVSELGFDLRAVTSYLVAPFICLVFVSLCNAGCISKVMGAAPLVALGEISYGLYLIHRAPRHLRLLGPMGIVAYFIVCNALSWLLYRYFEFPARTSIVRWYEALVKGPSMLA